jgi:hypothetical protein
VQIAAGSYHCLALSKDGSLVPWGDNTFRQIKGAPAEATNVVQIAAGAYHSMALRADGRVFTWGNSNSTANYPAAAGFGVVQIAAGAYHCLALKNDGTVLTWGNNSYLPPAAPTNLTNVLQAAAGNQFNLLLSGDRVLTYLRRGASSNAQVTFSNIARIAAFQDVVVALEVVDSDRDGLGDGSEIGLYKTDPKKSDTDGDGMSDGWEVSNNFDARSATDASFDADKDGLTNLREHQLATAPRNSDTDGDGLPDGAEVNQERTDPKKSDTDGDKLLDGAEVRLKVLGLSPLTNNAANLTTLINNASRTPLYAQSQYDAHGAAQFSNGMTAVLAAVPPIQISLPAQSFVRIAFGGNSAGSLSVSNIPSGWSYDPVARDVSGRVPGTNAVSALLSAVATSGVRLPIAIGVRSLTNQTITFTNLPGTNAFVSNGVIPLRAVASSGLAVTFTSANPNILQIVGGTNAIMRARGTNTITASQSGNTNFLAASNVVRTIVIK